MRTVILITATTKKLPSFMYNWVSKNEPSRIQIEEMLREISAELNEKWVIKYKDFEQDPGRVKFYSYLLDDEKCLIAVERRTLVEFAK